jgi:hypothetical protein
MMLQVTSHFQRETTPGGTTGLRTSSLVAMPLGCSLCYTVAVAPETVERTYTEHLDAPAGWHPLIADTVFEQARASFLEPLPALANPAPTTLYEEDPLS